MSAPPEVSVIVPTYGDRAPLRRCLAALARQSAAPDRFEVLVIENGPLPLSEPGTDPNVRFLHQPRPGSYAARNLAIEHARGAILAFTDADCEPSRDWVGAGAAALRADGAPPRLAGHVTLLTPTLVDASALHERVFGFKQERLAARGTSVTANMWTLREVVDAIGPFDASRRSGGDVAWGLAAQAAGYAIRYAPEVQVRHPARDAAGLLEKARRVYGGEFAGRFPATVPRALVLVRGMTLLKPPLRRMRDALATGELNAVEALAVAVLEMRLRVAQFVEHVRLTFGGEARR